MRFLFPPLKSLIIMLMVLLLIIAVSPAGFAQSQKPQSLLDVAKQYEKLSGKEHLSALYQPGVRLGEGGAAGIDAAANEAALIRTQIISKLTNHPRLSEARLNVCSASFQIRLNKARYFPKLTMSITGGDKLVNKTTRADELGGRDSPEYDGRGINATLQLRQQIYDWGDTAASIDLARVDRNRALLERLNVLDEQTAAVLQAAMEYAAQTELYDYLRAQELVLEKSLTSVEARFEAGAGRLSEVRQAQLLRLENQSQIDMSMRRREQASEILTGQYMLTAQEAQEIVAQFKSMRPPTPPIVPAAASLQGRILSLNLQATDYESKRLEAQRYPRIEGVLAGRAWDINRSSQCGGELNRLHPDAVNRGSLFSADYRRGQNCHTHEFAGSLEFTLPLYDGGANKAQRGEVRSRQKGIEAQRLDFIRTHEAESNYIAKQLVEYQNRLISLNDQLEKLKGQLESLQATQGHTQFNPLEVARLQAQLIKTETEQILLGYQTENIHLEGLLRANILASTLGIELETPGC